MLKIAVVGNTHQDVKKFVEYKFKDRIEFIHHSTATYTLRNGDTLYLCYDEQSRNMYNSMAFDAFIVIPLYQSLLDVIMYRTMRT